MEKSFGETPDISGLLLFKFWETVYYHDPVDEEDKIGRWCGRALNHGDTMCFWILTQETEELIVCGTVCSATNTPRPNLTIALGEDNPTGEPIPTTNPTPASGEVPDPTFQAKENQQANEDQQHEASEESEEE